MIRSGFLISILWVGCAFAVHAASAPPSITVQPESIAGRVGDTSLMLSVTTAGEVSGYQWRWNGAAIAGATASRLDLSEARLAEAGFYDVVVSNDAGATISERALVTLFPAADPGWLELDPNWAVDAFGAGNRYQAVATSPTGGVYVVSQNRGYGGLLSPSIVRLDANGAVDPTFVSQVQVEGEVFRAVVRGDGSLLLAGDFVASDGVRRASAMVAVDARGNWDRRFTSPFDDTVVVRDVGLTAAGDLFVVRGARGIQEANTLLRLDATGRESAPFTGSLPNGGYVHSIGVYPDGRVAVVSIRGGFDWNVSLYWFDAGGALLSGSFELRLASVAAVGCMRVDAAGRLHVFGSDFSFALRAIRFGADRLRDEAWTVTGPTATVLDALIDPASGASWIASNNALYRVEATGGSAQTLRTGAGATTAGLARDAQERVYHAFSHPTNDPATGGLQRYSSTGVIDSSFVAAGEGAKIEDLHLQSDGQVVLAGNFGRVGTVSKPYVARVTAAGEVDGAFGGFLPNARIKRIAPTADGKLFVAGDFVWVGAPALQLSRLRANGIRDTTFSAATSVVDSSRLNAVVRSRFGGGVVTGASDIDPFAQFRALNLVAMDATGAKVDGFGTALDDSGAEVAALLERRDGGWIVGGRAFSGQAGEPLAFLDAAGQLETNQPRGLDHLGTVRDVLRMPDGRLWLVGSEGVDLRTADGRASVAGFNPPGATRHLAGRPGRIVGWLQADGSLIALGDSSFGVTVAGGAAVDYAARFSTTGALDRTFRVWGLSGRVDAAVQRDDGGFYLAVDGRLRRTRALQAPQVLAVDGAGSLTAGQTLRLVASLAGFAAESQWYRNGGVIPGAVGPTLVIDAVMPEDSGRYSLRVANPAGTTWSEEVAVEVWGVESGVAGSHELAVSAMDPADAVTFTVSNRLSYVGVPERLRWSVLPPEGWQVMNATGVGATTIPVDDTEDLAEWIWNSPVADDSVEFTYDLVPPSESRGRFTVTALATVERGGAEYTEMVNPDPLRVRRISRSAHSADTDGDFRFDLSELLRVIALYNTRIGTVRSGRYRLDGAAVDGFGPDSERSTPTSLIRYHSGDINRDGELSLSELLRVIELYNTRSGTQRTGAYRPADSTVDGFASGGE